MRMRTLLAAAAIGAMAASTAVAGPHKDHDKKDMPPAAQPMGAQPMDAGDQGQDASGSEMYGQPVVLPADSTPPDQAARLTPADPQVTANPPVPDTAANRARFGGPDSNGGKKTRASGN